MLKIGKKLQIIPPNVQLRSAPLPTTKVYLRLEGHRTQKAVQWHRACYFVLGHNGTILALAATTSCLGAQAAIGVAQPGNAPGRQA